MTAKKKGTCSRCRRPAVYDVRCNRESLCEKCFVELFEKRVRRTIRTNKLLRKDDRTLVALSGGKDSAVVLYILKGLLKKAPEGKLAAISIDQGIKGTESALEASKTLCKDLDVEHHIYSFKKEYGLTMDGIVRKIRHIANPPPPCSFCGVLRRKLLNTKAKELCATKIATGHNMDDEIQSSMMNYVRGDVEAIARMGALVGAVRDPRFVQRIKPLRDSPEREVRMYADIKGIRYEGSRCPHSREAFRGTIRKAIEDIDSAHPGSRFQILRSTDTLIEILRSSAKAYEIGTCERCGDPCSSGICKFCQIIENL